ncbi:MAG TPA: hypothetical protein VFB38_14305 [Chthonomonadaceae bacterium]|nr:hypothetical protein [Chthonomonadaceae bacterium]
MRFQFSRYKKTGGFSLVEILVVVLLLVLIGGGLAYFYLGHGSAGKKPGDIVHTPITRTNDVVCQNNLSQIRMSLQMQHDSDPDGKYPASLSELRLPSEMLSCPVGHEPYQYDPTTGQVHCMHPGHENY